MKFILGLQILFISIVGSAVYGEGSGSKLDIKSILEYLDRDEPDAEEIEKLLDEEKEVKKLLLTEVSKNWSNFVDELLEEKGRVNPRIIPALEFPLYATYYSVNMSTANTMVQNIAGHSAKEAIKLPADNKAYKAAINYAKESDLSEASLAMYNAGDISCILLNGFINYEDICDESWKFCRKKIGKSESIKAQIIGILKKLILEGVISSPKEIGETAYKLSRFYVIKYFLKNSAIFYKPAFEKIFNKLMSKLRSLRIVLEDLTNGTSTYTTRWFSINKYYNFALYIKEIDINSNTFCEVIKKDLRYVREALSNPM